MNLLFICHSNGSRSSTPRFVKIEDLAMLYEFSTRQPEYIRCCRSLEAARTLETLMG
jgi:hypothetical protein